MCKVPKTNGNVWICVDLMKLNSSIWRERHILPSMEETLAQLGNARVFSKLDTNSGFWQIKLAKELTITTFITLFGCYCFKRLPFGISLVPEVFQRKMSEILNGLMDNTLVFGKDHEEHNKWVHIVLQKPSESKITLSWEKCEVAQSQIKFLWKVIDENGVHPDPQKFTTIHTDTSTKQLVRSQTILGDGNTIKQILSSVIRASQANQRSFKNEWQWGDQQQKSFGLIKQDLSTSPVLELFESSQETIVSANASSYGLAAVLKQKQPSRKVRPIHIP